MKTLGILQFTLNEMSSLSLCSFVDGALREQLRSTLSSAVADQDATARQLERLESSRRGLQRQLEEAQIFDLAHKQI